MRQAYEEKTLITDGMLESYESTIATSRKTFRMVIDGIYSDKIGAIVQEIAANAFDSHKRAKQDRPFFVHCPTVLLPEFYVRDYGVGMTHEVMKDVYIVIGKSDKETTNEEVGTWGLGSKSPFAYGDQYYITCYDGVEARHYGYGISEKGIPTLYLMDVTPSDEPVGVKVGFGVEPQDYETFKARIQAVAIGHNGAFESNIELGSIGQVAFAGSDWQSYETPSKQFGSGLSKDGLKRGGWYVRQGCILYPIDSRNVSVPQHYDEKNAYVLDCPIGSVSITTSREAIAYDTSVVEYLNKRVESVKSEIADAIWEEVKDVKSVHDFFEQIDKKRPNWVTVTRTHPATGLSSRQVPLGYPMLAFQMKFEFDRWELVNLSQLDVTNSKAAPRTVFMLDSIAPLLDPSRGTDAPMSAKDWLTKSEVRRIFRFARAYLDRLPEKHTNPLFLVNTGWDADYLEACFPNFKRVDVTFKELRDAVPMRVTPPASALKQQIRGLALAKAAGDQKPVYEVLGAAELGAVAWVSSDQYRRQASALFKLLKRFDIKALYIAAPQASHYMTDAQVPHLRDALAESLAKKGLTFTDWYFVKQHLNGYAYQKFFDFLRRMDKAAPAQYERLIAGEGYFSKIAAGVRPVLSLDKTTFSDEENRALEAILAEDGQTFKAPEADGSLKKTGELIKFVSSSYYDHPTRKFVNELMEGAKSPYAKLVSAILILEELFPSNEKH